MPTIIRFLLSSRGPPSPVFSLWLDEIENQKKLNRNLVKIGIFKPEMEVAMAVARRKLLARFRLLSPIPLVVICFILCPGMSAAMPASAYLISSNPPCENPGYCDTLFQTWPEPIPWHIVAVDETYGDSAGIVWLETGLTKSPDTALFFYKSLVFILVVPVEYEIEIPWIFEFNDFCGTPYPPRPLDPPPPDEIHSLLYPEPCHYYPVDTWLDNGDGVFGVDDTLILAGLIPMPRPPGVESLLVTGIYCGWRVDIAEPIPTMTEWGLILCGVLLAGFMTWFMLRRGRRTSIQH